MNVAIFNSQKFWTAFFLLIAFLYVVSLIAMPIVYDTMHLSDTLFILSDGWRVALGLQPGIDYESYYSGLTSRYLALSYRIFGFQVRALDWAALLQYATLLPLAFLAMAGRVNLLTYSGVAAILATMVLTRAPMEEFTALTQMVSAHSFSYNRFGLALCLVALLAVLLSPGTSRQECQAGLAGGIAIAMALMCKWSFVIVLPPAVLALLLQQRWLALGALSSALFLTFFLLDPTGQKFLNTVAYGMATTAAEYELGRVNGFIFKTQRILLSHFFVLLLLIASLIWTLRGMPERRWTWGLSVFAMALGLGIACLPMGPFGLIGHQILPVAAVLSLIFANRTQYHVVSILTLAITLSLGVILPHFGNAILVTAAAYKNREEGLIARGPMSGYLHRYWGASSNQTVDEINIEVAKQITLEGKVTRSLEYPVFVDGLAALQKLSPQGQHGIIAEGQMSFEFATSSPPVTSYPLWALVNSPELDGRTQIPDDADIVLLLRQGGTPLGNLLRDWIGPEFRPCLETPIWNVFVRIESGISGCVTK